MANPVVLLHGFTGSVRSTWQPTGLIDLLADVGRECVAIDLPGHGASEQKSHDPDDYTNLEQELLKRLPDGPLDGVGFSAGARILLVMASLEPSRWDKLVVAGVGQNLFVKDQGRGERIARGVAGNAAQDDPMAQAFSRYASEPGQDADAMAAFMRRRHAKLSTDELANITAPTAVVLGTNDFAGPAEPLVDALPNATLHSLRNVDHFATPKDFGFIDAVLSHLG
ncbi:MAG: alpha/beta fold hydrolase [Actinobacteria bacterium]|nr:alpha/beta fold hydrolase [Actinomycetota bacterium]